MWGDKENHETTAVVLSPIPITKRKRPSHDRNDTDNLDDSEKDKMQKRTSIGGRKMCGIRRTPLRVVLLVCGSIVAFSIWYWALLGWGTVAPPFIWYYTAPFRGPAIGPPRHFKPSSRFVVRCAFELLLIH